MDIHEHQAKELAARFGLKTPAGAVARTPDDAVAAAKKIGGERWVVKAQVHSGARGKAGGIKLCRTEAEVAAAAGAMLGTRLVTNQTGPKGKPVTVVYVEAATDLAREFYVAFVIDRGAERPMLVASAAGGMDIEQAAHQAPDTIVRRPIDPVTGLLPFEARLVASALGLDAVLGKAAETLLAAWRAFRGLDATMLEINPLALTTGGEVLALDLKLSVDDNSLFRHADIAEMRDPTQEDPREASAADAGLAYVGLDGAIGCIVNGAGLALATLDMIKLAGGEPANFLDIGGGATAERVAKSFRAVLQDKGVEVVLVNIFAGINRCDLIAAGVIQAIEEVGLTLPVVVRLAGNRAPQGLAILRDSGHSVVTAATLAEAAEKSVAAWRNAVGSRTAGVAQ